MMIKALTPEAAESLSEEEIKPTISSLSAEDLFSSISNDQLEKKQHAWRKLIDDYLLEWARDPKPIEDEGLTAPSREIIRVAVVYAQQLGSSGFVPPKRIIPDGEGGIVFEWLSGDDSVVLEFGSDGSIELVHIDPDDRVSRENIA